MRIINAIFFTLLTCFVFVNQFVFASQEVVTPRIRVIYEQDNMAEYAQQVAFEAEKALDVLVPLFNFQPRTINIILQSNTDIYNAQAITPPHSKIMLPALFPTEVHLGLRARSHLYHLLIHELTHNLQTTYTLTEPPKEIVQAAEGGLLNMGNIAKLPPAWFLEGIAVWVESKSTTGGRNGDALTQGTIDTLFLAACDNKSTLETDTDNCDLDKLSELKLSELPLPKLIDIGLATYNSWPAGDARYLLGGAFVEYLVSTHDFETILATLQAYNQGGIIGGALKDFSTAWQETQGSSLNSQWLTWQKDVIAKALVRKQNVLEGKIKTNTGWYTRSPVISPNGTKLAWVSFQNIKVINIKDITEENLPSVEPIISLRAPKKLAWLDNNTLVYTHYVSNVAGTFSELFSLDVNTGKEKQLTPTGTRVVQPTVIPDGCVLLIHDVLPESSKLLHWCDSNLKTFWQAPKGLHILASAVSKQGQIVLSIWQKGFTDLALLDITTNKLTYLNQNPAQDLDPKWLSEDTIIYRSDQHVDSNEKAAFDIYQINIANNTTTRLTRSLGGAFQPETTTEGLWYTTMTNRGTNIAFLDWENTLAETISAENVSAETIIAETISAENVSAETIIAENVSTETIDFALEVTETPLFKTRNYSPLPSLVPFAIAPSHLGIDLYEISLTGFDFSVGATLLAQDITEKHRYNIHVGFADYLKGHLYGSFIYADYSYTPLAEEFNNFRGPRFSVQLGVWPHSAHYVPYNETALGARGTLEYKLPFNISNSSWIAYGLLRAGIVHLESRKDFSFNSRFSVRLSEQRSDTWGYKTSGFRFGLDTLWSATTIGPSYGAWGSASYYKSLASLTGTRLRGYLELYAQGGYRASQPIPIGIRGNYSSLVGLGYRYSQNVNWHYGDGLYSLERITFTPRVRSWADDNFRNYHLGADLNISLDTLINYMGAVTLGATLGYANGIWTRLNFGLSF